MGNGRKIGSGCECVHLSGQEDMSRRSQGGKEAGDASSCSGEATTNRSAHCLQTESNFSSVGDYCCCCCCYLPLLLPAVVVATVVVIVVAIVVAAVLAAVVVAVAAVVASCCCHCCCCYCCCFAVVPAATVVSPCVHNQTTPTIAADIIAASLQLP